MYVRIENDKKCQEEIRKRVSLHCQLDCYCTVLMAGLARGISNCRLV